VKDFLTGHPELAQELAALRKLPQDQRKAARQQYMSAHPDVAAEAKQLRQDRRGTWAEVAGQAAAELAKYPAVQALVTDLGKAPAGQRAAEAKTYLAAHPDAKTQLKQLRSETRTRVQSCRAGK
jgi:hemophore-related protein